MENEEQINEVKEEGFGGMLRPEEIQYRLYEIKSEVEDTKDAVHALYEQQKKIKRLVGSICTCAAIITIIILISFLWICNEYMTLAQILK